QSIERAVEFLSAEQMDEGGYDGGAFLGGITSEATSQVIIGLTANGIDPTSEPFTKSVDLIEHLLSFQHDSGGFTHTLGDKDANNMATEQALQALVAYNLFLKDEGSLYQFNLDDDEEEDNSVEVGKVIEVEAGQTISFKDSGSKVVLPEGLPEGTTVSITIPDKKKEPSGDLKLAGDWFDFNFDFNGKKLPEGTVFTLTLEVAEGQDIEKAAIYHYDEEKNIWELVPTMSRDRANHTITVQVSHFSIYAVLAEEEKISGGDDPSREEEKQDEKPEPEEGEDIPEDKDEEKGEEKDKGNKDVDENSKATNDSKN